MVTVEVGKRTYELLIEVQEIKQETSFSVIIAELCLDFLRKEKPK